MQCGRECPLRRTRCRSAWSSCARHFAMTRSTLRSSRRSRNSALRLLIPVSRSRPSRSSRARIPRRSARPSKAALIAGLMVVAIGGAAVLLWNAKADQRLAGSAGRRGLHHRDGFHRLGGARHDFAGRQFHRFRFRPRRCVGCLRRPDRHRRLPEPDARTDSRTAQSGGANARLLPHGLRGDDLVVQEQELEHPRRRRRPALRACRDCRDRLVSGSASVSSTTQRRPATHYSSPMPTRSSRGQQIYVAPPGIHCHFPLWSHDGKTIYFVRGFVPDEMDLWQISAGGGDPQRLTRHNSRVSFPTLLDERTLLYLATSADGLGPWVYASTSKAGPRIA